MGKMVSPPFLGCFDPILFILAGNKDMHKISDFGQLVPLTTELAAFERLNFSHRLIMGNVCLHASSFIFYRIIIKVTDNQDRHKSPIHFDFGSNQTTHFGVISP